MASFVVRWLVTTLAVFVAAHIVPGVSYGGEWSSLFGASLLLGILNAFVRPALLLLSLPWIIITMGIFILILNALLLMFVSAVIPGFAVSGFWSAFFGSIVVSLVSWPLSCFFRSSDGRVHAITHHPGLKKPMRASSIDPHPSEPPHTHTAVFVKICGITCAEDAVMACKYGANAIGINLYPRSKRHIPIDSATPWLQSMENRIQRVAVVVNPNAAELDSIRDSRCFDAIQFHGDESPEFCAAAGFPHWIKAFRVRKEDDMAILTAFPNARILIDAWAPGQYGGTGHRVDWKIARTLIDKNPGRQIILAGGLTPDNVAEAIRTTHPWGVDTAGGVEFEPGRKDEYLVREFIEQARSAWQAIP